MDQHDLVRKKQDINYMVLEKLKEYHQQLTSAEQMKISFEMLLSLATTLVNQPDIFKIIQNLMEIQHITERELHAKRCEILEEYGEKCKRHLYDETLSDYDKVKNIAALKMEERDRLKAHDLMTIATIDEKQQEQQTTLESAGLPGFYATTQRKEIEIQMRLLDFILQISKLECLQDMLDLNEEKTDPDI